MPAGRVTALLVVAGRELPVLEWEHPAAEPNRHVRGPALRVVLPAARGADRFTLRLVVRDAPDRGSDYVMPFTALSTPKTDAHPSTSHPA